MIIVPYLVDVSGSIIIRIASVLGRAPFLIYRRPEVRCMCQNEPILLEHFNSLNAKQVSDTKAL